MSLNVGTFNVPNKIPMGLGSLGAPTAMFKMKFRWTFTISFCNGTISIPSDFVKVGARPNLDIEEQQIDFLNGRMWIPGKASWQNITVTYYDVAAASNTTINNLYSWLASVYNILDPVNLQMGTPLNRYEGNGLLFLYDGCGNAVEGWELGHCWPQAINFGDLDMTSADHVTIELTLRYSQVQYQNYCGGTVTVCGCYPCQLL